MNVLLPQNHSKSMYAITGNESLHRINNIITYKEIKVYSGRRNYSMFVKTAAFFPNMNKQESGGLTLWKKKTGEKKE